MTNIGDIAKRAAKDCESIDSCTPYSYAARIQRAIDEATAELQPYFDAYVGAWHYHLRRSREYRKQLATCRAKALREAAEKLAESGGVARGFAGAARILRRMADAEKESCDGAE